MMTASRRRKHRVHSREYQARKRTLRHGGHVIGPGHPLRAEMMRIYRDCPKGMEVDHVMPLSKGGAHAPWNLQYLTPEANVAKGDG